MIQQDCAFFVGILSTLQMVSTSMGSSPGGDAFYHQIVNANDVESLCRVARSYCLHEKSGLVKYGYAVPDCDVCESNELKKMSPPERLEREKRIISCAQRGDELAKSLLMRDYEVVINKILKRKFSWFLDNKARHLDREDLRQEARYAVLKALHLFDPTRLDANFRSLVELRVQSHLHYVIRRREAIVAYPQKAYLERTSNVLNSVVPSVDENGDDLIECVADDWADADIVQSAEKREVAARVRSLMWFLPDRQHFLLRIFFGFDGEPLTKNAIAKDFGKSDKDVSETIEAALDSLRLWTSTGKFPKRAHKPDLKRLGRKKI